jgi:hypothetical protein
MAAEGAWARHYQEVWQSRAGDPRLPYWLRVAAAAYGSHSDNGHARFKRGELALILGTVDRASGQIRPYENLARAITDAIEYGWLGDESFWGCLVVPAHAIKKGSHSHVPACPIHIKRRRKVSEPLTQRAVRDLKATPDERFEARIPHSVSGSQREPLSSVLSLPRQRQEQPTEHGAAS